MRKPNKITDILLILFLINFAVLCYGRTHPRELKLQSIEKTENSIILHINDQKLNIPKEKLEESFLIDMDDIVDWNTDGTELALSLKNENELYATQTENIYAPKFKNYVGFDEIQNIEETESAYEITTKDGSTYIIDK